MSKKFLLALDAGHGLYTEGKRCLKSIDPNETREWILNDRISKYIENRAKTYKGFEIIRVDDETGKTDVSLRTRCQKANNSGADFYLSNHHNAGINGGSGGGVVAFCMRGASESTKNWRDELYNAVVSAGKLKGNRTDPTQEVNYNVLVWSDMPAVLIEYGFMDSTVDVKYILSEEYAKTVGFAVADCIAKLAGLEKNEMDEELEPVKKFNTFDELPEYGKETIQKLIETNALKGTGNGLEISEDMLRILVILDRLGKL